MKIQLKLETVEIKVRPSRVLKERVEWEDGPLIMWFDEDMVEELTQSLIEEINNDKCNVC